MTKGITDMFKRACKEAKESFGEWKEEWKEDTLNYTYDHPYTAGFLGGCAIVWTLMVLSATITGKVWNLVDRD